MRAALLAEFAMIFLTAVTFAVVHGRGPWRHTPAGRQLMFMSVATAGEAATLFAVTAGVRLPIWLFVIGYGAINAVMVTWLVMLIHARRPASSGPGGAHREEQP